LSDTELFGAFVRLIGQLNLNGRQRVPGRLLQVIDK